GCLPRRIDLARHRTAQHPDLHVVVDLEPNDLTLEAGDEAVEPRGGDDLVADLKAGLQRRGITLTAALRTDQQEVSRGEHQRQEEEADEAAAPAVVSGEEGEY